MPRLLESYGAIAVDDKIAPGVASIYVKIGRRTFRMMYCCYTTTALIVAVMLTNWTNMETACYYVCQFQFSKWPRGLRVRLQCSRVCPKCNFWGVPFADTGLDIEAAIFTNTLLNIEGTLLTYKIYTFVWC